MNFNLTACPHWQVKVDKKSLLTFCRPRWLQKVDGGRQKVDGDKKLTVTFCWLWLRCQHG